MKKTYSIFLASSFELRDERQQFEISIRRLMKRYEKKNVVLNLEIWEDMDDAFNTTCKQEDYNEYLRKCQIFVMLFWTKVGKYTREEFDLAYQLFLEKGSPSIYVYEKTVAKEGILPWEKQSKEDFLAFLQTTGKQQFQSTFEHHDTFIKKFENNLDALFNDPNNSIFAYGDIAKLLSLNGISEPLGFLGREDELQKIQTTLEAKGKVMLINAEGGIGKTTLAAKYWHENLYNYEYHAWLYCETGIIQALKELAPKLNIDFTNMDEAQQLYALKVRLAELPNFLLVLDNANDEKEIQRFKKEFEGFHWHVLLTSRCANVLHPSQEFAIEHLPPKLAKELFTRHYQENTADFELLLDKVLLAINYHTLLIEIFAKNLKKASKIGLDLASFLDKLTQEGLFLGEDSFHIQTDYTGAVKKNVATTDEILAILYDFSKLSENERHALVNMALLPVETYNFEFLRDLMVANDRNERKVYLKTLGDLLQKGWLAGTMDEHYRISPLIQELTLIKNQATLGEDVQCLLNRLNTILKNDGFNFINVKLSTGIPYAKPVEHLSKCLMKHPSLDIANYNFCCGIYFNNIGDLVAAIKCYQNYHIIFQKLLETKSENLKYKNGLATSYGKLGVIYQVTGDLKNALIHFKESKVLFKEIYESCPENLSCKNRLAISYEKLGGLYQITADRENALTNFKERNRISKEVYESCPENLSYKNGLAISHEKLGTIYQIKGDRKNALIHLIEHFKLTKEINESNPKNLEYKNGLAIAYSKLADIFQAIGNLEDALTFFQQTVQLFLEIYESSPENLEYKNGLAISYAKLGGVYQAKGDLENALINFKEQNMIAKEICESSPKNLDYKNILAISLAKLSSVFELKKQYKEAINTLGECYKHYQEIRQIVQGGNVNFTFNYASTCWKIFNIYQIMPNKEVFNELEIKQIQKEGYDALKPFADTNLLPEIQKEIFELLSEGL